MPRQEKAVVISADSAYIDPLDCNSTISYNVIQRGKRVSGSVQLSDCNRKIDWWFGGDPNTSVAKINKAIEMLQSFRDEYASAVRIAQTRYKVKKSEG